MRRHVLLLMVALCRPAPTEAQQTEYFEPTPPKARFTLRWEALLRYDSIYNLRVRPDIERGRFEFRPEVAFEPSDRWKIAVRAVGNIGTDDNDQNARNFDNYRSDGATLDRWYVEARPGGWMIFAGRFGVPLDVLVDVERPPSAGSADGAHRDRALKGVRFAAGSAEIVDPVERDRHRQPQGGEPKLEEKIGEAKIAFESQTAGVRLGTVLPDVVRLQVLGVEIPVRRGGFDGEAIRVPSPPHGLAGRDLRPVAFPLRSVEPGRGERESRRAGRDLA